MSLINRRKNEHIRIVAEDEQTDRCKRYFDAIRLTHRALPEINLADADPSVEFMGKTLSFPLLISSMTGGKGRALQRINRNLALAAQAENIALAVGSQRILFTQPKAAASFSLRRYAPSIPLFANLGAVQLNDRLTLEHCREAVRTTGADGLYLHLNPLQEAVQPEGDTCFRGIAARIGEIAAGLDVPVLIKEVGAGISAADAERLIQAGVKYIDVAGAGGTSWSRVESARSRDPSLGELFSDWGIPTPAALRELAPYRHSAVLIASGGIRSGIDMVKAIILGASLCGAARPFLEPALESAEAVREEIRRFRREFVTAMFLLGAARVEQIRGNSGLILSDQASG